MTDVPHPFAPFSPSPPIAPDQPKAEKPAKEKKPRKAKSMVGQTATGPIASQTALTSPETSKPARKPRAAKPKTLKGHSPKFDLQTTLAAAQLLKEDDFPLFENLVVALDEAGKPQRDRVLAALGKVFQ